MGYDARACWSNRENKEAETGKMINRLVGRTWTVRYFEQQRKRPIVLKKKGNLDRLGHMPQHRLADVFIEPPLLP